ncbi:hypothetical protein [Spiroplasma endosymbiont of Virgichneumon dumeticola]
MNKEKLLKLLNEIINENLNCAYTSLFDELNILLEKIENGEFDNE